MNSNIELKEIDESILNQVKNPRKIKFKNVSFTNIGRKFDDFRVKRLEKKLAKEIKKELKSEFTSGDLKKGLTDSSRAERILVRKSLAITRLEEKINFLKFGELPSKAAAEYRAIKLKDKMMQNLRVNIYGLYSVPEDKKEEVFKEVPETNESDTNKVIEEEINKLNDKMNQMETPTDKEIKTSLENKAEESVNVDNLSVADIKQTVEGMFNEEKNNLQTEDVQKAVEEGLNQVHVEDYTEEYVSPIKPIVPIKTRKIPDIGLAKVSPNIPVKGLNDDIFSKDNAVEIEEPKTEATRDLPVVTPDREEMSLYEKTKNSINELNNLYDQLGEVKMDDQKTRDELTQKVVKLQDEIIKNKELLSEEEKIALEQEFSEEPKEESKEEVKEDIGFDFSEASAKDIENAVEKVKNTSDLRAMAERIRILQNEDKIIQARVEQAKAEEEAKSKAYDETIKKLIQYGNELEAKCNKNIEKETELKNKAREKDAAINFMLQAMEKPTQGIEKKK